MTIFLIQMEFFVVEGTKLPKFNRTIYLALLTQQFVNIFVKYKKVFAPIIKIYHFSCKNL